MVSCAHMLTIQAVSQRAASVAPERLLHHAVDVGFWVRRPASMLESVFRCQWLALRHGLLRCDPLGEYSVRCTLVHTLSYSIEDFQDMVLSKMK